MELILLTTPTRMMGEYDTLFSLFDLGLQTLHIRKPAFSEEEMTRIVNSIPPTHRKKVMLHGHGALVKKYHLKGIHHTQNESYIPDFGKEFVQSKSFHSLQDLQEDTAPYDYGFISPVFDSISKEGYPSQFTIEELKKVVAQSTIPLVALGGIDASNVPLLQGIGLKGVAVLGAIWNQIIYNKLLHSFVQLQEVVSS